MTTFYVRQGDAKQVRSCVLSSTDVDGVSAGASLAAALAVTYQASHLAAAAPVTGTFTKDADQTTNPGKGTFELDGDDFDIVGIWALTFEAVWADGTTTTFPEPGTDTLVVSAQIA